MKDSDWWMKSPDRNWLLRCGSRSFDILSSSCTQPVLISPVFFCSICAITLLKMVGAMDNDELLLGYSPDGMFEIVLRPGKFFFHKFFFMFFVKFFKIELMYRV